MAGFLRKFKAELRGVSQRDSGAGQPGHHQEGFHSAPAHHRSSSINDPSSLEILRYRYHHGTNLGSIFVIERWLHGSRFPHGANGSSELAAVEAWVNKIGIDATKQKFEDRWNNSVSDDDIRWLSKYAKCTTVRLPVGYYDLPGDEFTQGTPFQPYAHVYSEAWNQISAFISRLREHSIGVLVDLHALPGGANAQEHSGTNSGHAEFWGSDTNRKLGIRCCQFLANATRNGLELAGIQLVNEAEWDAKSMYDWYDECISAIAPIDPSVPVIISDGWNLSKAIDYSLRKNSVDVQTINPVVIDTHYYWAFSDDDKKKSPQQIIAEVDTKLRQLDGKEGSVHDRGAVQAIVGEYSCVLTDNSWAKSHELSKEELVKKFGQAQSRRYQQRAGGSFFWTWKMDWMPGGEWGFKAQSDAENIVPPHYATISTQEKDALIEKACKERDERMQHAVQHHVAYWNRTDPDGSYEHDKYEYGWKVGFRDAFAFFEGKDTQGDKIGMLEMWVLKRIKESGYNGGFTWLFEQGLRKGVQDFYTITGI